MTQTTPNLVLVNLTGGAITGINLVTTNQENITGLKFSDNNGNALLDAGEAPPTRWTILLMPTAMAGLKPQKQPLQVRMVATFLRMFPQEITPCGKYSNLDGHKRLLTLAPLASIGGTNAIVNFATVNSVLSAAIKFNDANANSLFDAGKTLAGWTIYIDGNGNGVIDPTEPTTVTGANGSYTFTNVPPGNYVLREVQQPLMGSNRSPITCLVEWVELRIRRTFS